MPRDGSPPGMLGGSGKPPGPIAPMNIGDVATPPFAVLPDPDRLFAHRASRLRKLATTHELEGYLRFLAAICDAQAAAVISAAPPVLPSREHLALARTHAMPPITLGAFVPDADADAIFSLILARLADNPDSATARSIIDATANAPVEARRAMMMAVVSDEIPADAIAAHVLAAAAVQVHFTRRAAALDVATLQKVANGACPACGGRPVASAVVGWEGAANTRFCTCSICATQWNAPRILCLSCGAEKGIVFHGLEGGSDAIKAETCESCNSYVKIFYQINDADLEVVADDVASLGLDLKLREDGVARASANPFLIGY